MLHALEVIRRYKSGKSQQQDLHQEPQWLQWLVAAEKPRINGAYSLYCRASKPMRY